MIELSPSLLSANFYNLEKDLEELGQSPVKYLHLDIMDGNYVPNISYGAGLIKSLRSHSDLIFDTHLMIENPENYIEDFVEAGSDIISIHPETTKHVHRTVQLIKSKGVKAGIVLNPASSLDILDYLIEDIDLILIMSVNPGFGGQDFIPSSLDKVRRVRELIDKKNPDVILEVDGGVKLDNCRQVIEAGADLLVAGSAVFNQNGILQNVEKFYEILEEYNEKNYIDG